MLNYCHPWTLTACSLLYYPRPFINIACHALQQQHDIFSVKVSKMPKPSLIRHRPQYKGSVSQGYAEWRYKCVKLPAQGEFRFRSSLPSILQDTETSQSGGIVWISKQCPQCKTLTALWMQAELFIGAKIHHPSYTWILWCLWVGYRQQLDLYVLTSAALGGGSSTEPSNSR